MGYIYTITVAVLAELILFMIFRQTSLRSFFIAGISIFGALLINEVVSSLKAKDKDGTDFIKKPSARIFLLLLIINVSALLLY